MRPIVSSIIAPSKNVAKILVNEFRNLPRAHGTGVRNTHELVDKMKNMMMMN